MAKLFKVKEFSELTGVTVRTLHHYDRIKLLIPEQKSASGYRLYSEDDMLRLQQILTLKFLGLSLDDIRKIMDVSKSDLVTSLQHQLTALTKQSQDIKIAINILKSMVSHLQHNQPIEWQNTCKMIGVLQMTQLGIDEWCKNYFTEQENMQMKDMFHDYDDDFMKKHNDNWNQLYKEFAKHKQEQPNSEISQKLAKKAYALIYDVWGDNMELGHKMWKATKAGGPIRKTIQADDETLEYFDQALYYYIEKLKQQ